MIYGIGVDDDGPERMWQTCDLLAAHLTAGVESLKGTAVVVSFDDDNAATVLAVYRNGEPE